MVQKSSQVTHHGSENIYYYMQFSWCFVSLYAMQFADDDDSSAEKLTNMLKIGNLFKLNRKYSSANNVYNKIIAEYPNDFRAYFNLAQLKTENSEFDKAVDLYKSVIALSSEVIESYGAIAALYIKLCIPETAAKYCNEGLNIVADDRACLYNLNVALRQTNNIGAAISLSWKVIGVEKQSLFLVDTPTVGNVPSDPSVLTVVCIKWGTKYGAEYVNNLYRAVTRNCPSNKTIKMVCFTDDSNGVHESVICEEFDPRLASFRAWWLKIQIFSPLVATNSLHSDWVLYIDLDTVICDSLGFVFDIIEDCQCPNSSSSSNNNSDDPANRIYVLNANTMQNEARSEGINSSIMLWRVGHHCRLFTCLLEIYSVITTCTYKFDHYLEMMLYRHVRSVDREMVDDPCGGESVKYCFYLQDVVPGRISDYSSMLQLAKAKSQGENSEFYDVVDRCAIVCFPLKPKPHQVSSSSSWMRQHWCGEEEEPS